MGATYEELQDMTYWPAPPGAATPRVQHKTEDGITDCYGTTAPTDATAGYAPGCVFRDVDSGAVYVNLGTLASSNFDLVLLNDYAPTRSSATGYGYGLTVDGDSFFTGTAASKSYLLSISGDRDSAYAATGDSNDAMFRSSGNNYAANDSNFILRGINSSINNRSGGTMGRLEGCSIGAQNKSGGSVTTLMGLTVTAENYGSLTGTDTFGGVDIVLKNEAAVAATEFGIRIRNENNSIADSVGAAIKITDTGANTGFDYFIDAYGATAATVAAIRLGQVGEEDLVIAFGNFADGADSGFAPGSIGLDSNDGLLFYCDSSGLWQQVAAA